MFILSFFFLISFYMKPILQPPVIIFCPFSNFSIFSSRVFWLNRKSLFFCNYLVIIEVSIKTLHYGRQKKAMSRNIFWLTRIKMWFCVRNKVFIHIKNSQKLFTTCGLRFFFLKNGIFHRKISTNWV